MALATRLYLNQKKVWQVPAQWIRRGGEEMRDGQIAIVFARMREERDAKTAPQTVVGRHELE